MSNSSMANTESNTTQTSIESSHGIGARYGIRYPILTGENYIHWKFRMEYNFRSRKLWSIVNGERVRPSDEPGRKEWDELDEEARQVIVMTVNDEQNTYLFDETSAHGMWNKLKEAYQERSVANTLRLKSAFNTYKKDPKHTMTKHVNKVLEMVQELKAVGVDVPKEDVILVLLNSLPDDYRMVRSSLKSQKEISVELVCARLKEEETDLGLESAHDEEKALLTHGRRKTAGIRCHHCGKPGHIKRFCFALKQKGFEEKPRNPNAQMRSERLCYKCNKPGHLMKDCKADKVNALVANVLIDDVAYVGTHHTGSFNDATWIIDSGASHHMCYEKSVFKEMKELATPKRILLGNGQLTYATHIGSVELDLQTENGISIGLLRNVLYTPGVTRNLFSVGSCIEAGNKVIFTPNEVSIKNRDEETVGKGHLNDGLWSLDTVPRRGAAFTAAVEPEGELWHKRFGHLGVENLKKVKNLVHGMESLTLTDFPCHSCTEGRQATKPTINLPKVTTRKLELVHSDVCGPIKPTFVGGSRYFLTFTDDHTRKSWIFCMEQKGEVLSKFLEFKSMAENQSGEKIRTLRCDNGGEYKGQAWEELCKTTGLEMSYSTPYAPNQNGVSERLNRTLVDMVISMLSSSGLPKELWGEALSTAVYLKNRSPHAAIDGKTPEEAWSEIKPSVRHLKVFGCKVSALLTKGKRNKFDPRVWWGVFVGYGNKSLGYRIWDPIKRQIYTRKT